MNIVSRQSFIEKELQFLRDENDDLKQSIKINKQIISQLLDKSSN